MKTTVRTQLNNVIQLLDSISGALYLVPVPGLNPAWKGFKFLWDAVQKVHDSRAQLEILTGSVAELILTLDRKLQDQPDIASSIDGELKSLRNLIDEICDLALEQANKSFLRRFLQGDEITSSVSSYHMRLLHLYHKFNISSEIDNKLWQSEFNNARNRDKEEFKLFLDGLMGNQEKLLRELFGKLEVQQSSLLEAIVAMRRGMVKMNELEDTVTNTDHSTEREFLEHGINLLQRRSDRVINIQPWTISSFEVEKKHVIGRGGFSIVYKAMFLGTAVALKELSATTSPKMLLNEIKVWERLRHPHVLQFIGAGHDEEPPFLVMELMVNGHVLDFLIVKPTANRVTLIHQTALGLVFLHARGIIHGDLKATNVLIKADESAVIADFGLSQIKMDVTSRSTAVLITGTKRWMAPEMMEGRPLAPPVDVYAWAMTAHEIFTGLVPFGAADESLLYEFVERKKLRPERPDDSRAAELGLTDEIWSLIERSWDPDAKLRPSASDIADTIKGSQNPFSDPYPRNSRQQKPNHSHTTTSTAQSTAVHYAQNLSDDYSLTSEIGRAGQYSEPFDDWTEVGGWPEAQNIDRMSKIEISHGDVVDGVRVSYQLKTEEIVTKTHGGDRRLVGTTLAPSEVLSEMRGRHGDVSLGWGIEIQEIEFVIEDTKSGSSRTLGPWGNGRARGVNLQLGSKFCISGPIMAFAGGCDFDNNHNSSRITALSIVTPCIMPD